MTFLEVFQIVMTCVSPVIIAWFGYSANKNEKQTKKYMESQEALKKANTALKEKEKEELQAHLDKIDNSINSLTKQVQNLEKSISSISEINKRIDGLVEMSNVNFEFCNSLSAVISSIGNALDSSDVIDSGTLQTDLATHKKKAEELVNRAVKIVYQQLLYFEQY